MGGALTFAILLGSNAIVGLWAFVLGHAFGRATPSEMDRLAREQLRFFGEQSDARRNAEAYARTLL